jgi:hypothetical protein
MKAIESVLNLAILLLVLFVGFQGGRTYEQSPLPKMVEQFGGLTQWQKQQP